MKLLLAFFFSFSSMFLFAQKKVIDHTAYKDWKKLENQQISNDGNFVSYLIKPLQGDGFLYIYKHSTDKLDSIPRGKNQYFSESNRFLVFTISPGYDTLRKCELEKIDKSKWPKDSLGIYLLDKDSLIKIPNVISFSLPESDWISYLSEEKPATIASATSKKWYLFWKKKEPKSADKKQKEAIKQYTAFNPISGKTHSYSDVEEFFVSSKGKYVALTLAKKEKEKKNKITLALLETETGNYSELLSKKNSVKNLCFNHKETLLCAMYSDDTTKIKRYELAMLNLPNNKWTVIADSMTKEIPTSKWPNIDRPLQFSENDAYLFFGVCDQEPKDQKDSLLETEKVKLDVWHYQDQRLQPQQLLEVKRDKKEQGIYVYQVEQNKLIALSNDSLKVPIPKLQYGDYLLAYDVSLYESTYNWTSPHLKDHYRISLVDGKVELLKKAVEFDAALSPTGNWYTYFKAKEGEHYLLNISTKNEICITCSRKDVHWEEDINGMPELAGPVGIIGWTKGEKELLLQSKYDLWIFTPLSSELKSISKESGLATKTRMSLLEWYPDSLYIDFDQAMVRGFHEKSNRESYYDLKQKGTGTELILRYSMDFGLVDLRRSKNETRILLRKQTVQDYPDVYLLNNDFTGEQRVSFANPQQSQYNWATVEKVEWISYNGDQLEGLIYKPENFDPKKEYPLMVYFYEKNSDRLHSHYAPKPTASVVFPTEYASAGYLVFIPDIRYQTGHPGRSAYDCIMSGTDKVLKLYTNIDSKRMGLQGQSWGGYQTAQLVTMTNRYAAAMAGAPVSNMFSAYGGIRWGSGMNRQFQYEKQQSRIGKTIWEAPELYIENSPLFHLPKVTTPLLIMANDKDGAVPWYQGIELFTGMKRLGKPCWMLNYNDDDHNLMKDANRLDLSIRMRQYFDHYLLGAPAPKWLLEGIPAVHKGKDMGLELMETKSED